MEPNAKRPYTLSPARIEATKAGAPISDARKVVELRPFCVVQGDGGLMRSGAGLIRTGDVIWTSGGGESSTEGGAVLGAQDDRHPAKTAIPKA